MKVNRLFLSLLSAAGSPAPARAPYRAWRNRPAPLGAVLALSVGSLLLPASGMARAQTKVCSDTAQAMLQACRYEVANDARIGTARCLNVADPDARAQCVEEVAEQSAEASVECKAQKAARAEVCGLLGESPYDPDFVPAHFETDFETAPVTNPYLPIKVGNQWTYENQDETVTVEVLDQTKRIESVTCVVVRDVVKQDGELVEDTSDWFAQANMGAVWYCGEEAKDFEVFEGDDPELPELVSIDGSFKAGREGAKPGILFPAIPEVGLAYRQEFDLGNAEDVAEVISIGYTYGGDPKLDIGVPKALAQLLCARGDCVVTRDFTPLEPDGEERKYYAPGVGLFLETDPENGESLPLVACNVDPRCAMLPVP